VDNIHVKSHHRSALQYSGSTPDYNELDLMIEKDLQQARNSTRLHFPAEFRQYPAGNYPECQAAGPV
jgi:hypothetical protein